jgi:hypothetical protein
MSAFQVQKSVLNPMTLFIQIFVLFSLFFAIFPGWNYRSHSLYQSGVNNCIGIVAAIGKQKPCVNPFEQAFSQLQSATGSVPLHRSCFGLRWKTWYLDQELWLSESDRLKEVGSIRGSNALALTAGDFPSVGCWSPRTEKKKSD